MSQRIVFESDTEPGRFGILLGDVLEYEAEFDSFAEAQSIASAHDQGARSYEDAVTLVQLQKLQQR